MSKLLWILMAFVSVLMLSACVGQHEESKSYYLAHPQVLSKEVAACRSLGLLGQSQPHCRLVIDAARSLVELIEAHQRNPQAFGQRVLDTEMKFAATWDKEREVKILLAVLGLSSPE